ncbi:hypothetical protein [Rhodobacter lacus]|uniref:Integrase n=1 Tax=Rhodobacter lacus TaxID=1641972 RepID=A0ABW5A508_9RHOB
MLHGSTRLMNNPAPPERWQRVLDANDKARQGKLTPLYIGEQVRIARSLDSRFGPMVDAFTTAKGILVAPESRPQLLRHVADALDDMAKVNEAKAVGDYSQHGKAAYYPELTLPEKRSVPVKVDTSPKTFAGTIDAWVAAKARGKDAAPVRPETERKYRFQCAEFVAFRGSDDLTTLTAREAEAWMNAMLEEAKLSNNSIRQRVQRGSSAWSRGRGAPEGGLMVPRRMRPNIS